MPYDLTLTEEQQALIQTARDFARKEITPVAGHYDESGEFPRAIIKKAWQTGLMYVEAPESVGGLGGSCLDHVLIQEEIAYGCLGFNTSLTANMLGAMPVLTPMAQHSTTPTSSSPASSATARRKPQPWRRVGTRISS